jgi:hypothetical protein
VQVVTSKNDRKARGLNVAMVAQLHTVVKIHQIIHFIKTQITPIKLHLPKVIFFKVIYFFKCKDPSLCS